MLLPKIVTVGSTSLWCRNYTLASPSDGIQLQTESADSWKQPRCISLNRHFAHVPDTGVKKLEASWHGRDLCEKHLERNSAHGSRRIQRLMTRSSSDSSYNPRSSPSDGAVHQLTDSKARVHSIDVPVTRQPGLLCSLSDNHPERNSPPACRDRGQPLQNTKKSSEILVRKPKSSKPKPPPRKYFKQDCTWSDQCDPDRKEKLLSEVAVAPSARLQVNQQLQIFSCLWGRERGRQRDFVWWQEEEKCIGVWG